MANLSIVRDLMKEKSISVNEMAEYLNMTPQGFLKILRENSTKVETLEAIANKLKVSPSVFFEEKVELMSEEEMQQHDKEVAEGKWHTTPQQEAKEKIVALKTCGNKKIEVVRLYDVSAAAGHSSFDEMISEEKVVDEFVIPTFKDISWMIFVKGSSMYPKYSSGDIIACRVLYESQFIQWGKVYVIATREQGILVKRLKESKKKDCIKAVSDNPAYDDFDVPKNEILGIALVVGVIRME